MSISRSLDLETILRAGISSLDLTEKQHAKAVREYKAIAEHLERKKTFWQKHSPDIYPQGSMDLGTCVRPWGRDEFDLDMVVVMYGVGFMTPLEAMNELGSALDGFATGDVTIKRLDRCFRVNYPGDFHIDIIPSKPDWRDSNPTAIRLPDRRVQGWFPSDPKAKKAYFEEAKTRVLVEFERDLINAKQADVAPPPQRTTVKNKSVLQLSVQMLKRHRDLHFKGREDATSSAIITILAARCYVGHQDIEAALGHILAHLGDSVRPHNPRVPNPRYFEEDYADKWVLRPPDREAAFWRWLQAARSDFSELASLTLKSATTTLEPILGKKESIVALESYDQQGITGLRESNLLGVNKTDKSFVSLAAAGATPLKKTDFFGNEPQ